MVDAGMMIGIGISLFGFGVAAHLGVDGWLRLKRFEREAQPPVPPVPAPRADAELVARLARIEQAVDALSIEVERVAESQRYVARALAERPPVALPPGRAEGRAEGRVNTPH